MFRYALFFTSVSFLVSCDPGHSLKFENNSENDVAIKILVKKEKLKNYSKIAYGFEEVSKGDSISTILKPKESYFIDFGMGTWEDNDIDSLISYIKNLKISTSDKEILYKSEKGLKELFVNKEGLFMKTVIKIDLK